MSKEAITSTYHDRFHGFLSAAQEIITNIGYRAVTDAQAASDFRAGSGLAVAGQLGTVAKAVAVSAAVLLGIWAITGELRAWGADRGDSFGMTSTIIRAAIISAVVVFVVEALLF